LRPESLERSSLSETLAKLVEEWAEETGIAAHATTTGTPHQLPPEAEVALLRMAQEALANVHKYANADRANVTLSYIDDRVLLDVLDDGEGFDPAELKTEVGAQDTGGFGLIAMRERMEQLGGRLHIESAPGDGTTLAAELQVGGADQEAKSQGPLEAQTSKRWLDATATRELAKNFTAPDG
jgi:signal transduction histidine kinase